MKKKIFRLVILSFTFTLFWSCAKDSSLSSLSSISDEVQKISQWYNRQILPNDNPFSFSNANNPNWDNILVDKNQDSVKYNILVYSQDLITRELRIIDKNGSLTGLVYQYDYNNKDSLIASSFTINGRIINTGYFDKNKKFHFTADFRKRNIVLMGTEIPVVDVFPDPPDIDWWPDYPGPEHPGPNPDPNPGGGGGGGSPSFEETPSEDPCEGRAAVNERLNSSKVKNSINTVKYMMNNMLYNGQKVEWGFDTKLNSLTGKKTFINSDVFTSENPAGLKMNTRWSANEGYTIGYTHIHPGNSAPSPSDLFFGAEWYYDVPVSERAIFTGYFTSTILTNDYIYVITIRNPLKWSEMKLNNKEVRNEHNLDYIERALKFKLNGYGNVHDGGVQALLELYGDIVNIYRSDINSQYFDFKPLMTVLGGPVVNPC